MSSEPLSITYRNKIAELRESVESVIRGKSEIIELCIAAVLARGHLLLDDVPGVGKTTLAHAMARSLSLSFHRIQFTSDLLPSDILGVSVFHHERQAFEFIEGPVFTNLLLADEINRATPKTQSALLEAMNEGTVTVEKHQMQLPMPFMVIATQNPTEHVGTYPLPESQLDRFLMKLTIGYPSVAEERQLLRHGGAKSDLDRLRPVVSLEELVELQERVGEIHLSEPILDYIMALIELTRKHDAVELGVSTRGALTLVKAAQALALVRGRDFVVPDDVKQLAIPVLAHRMIMHEQRSATGASPEVAFLQSVLSELPVPR
jgi:MoxR-like ATPase